MAQVAFFPDTTGARGTVYLMKEVGNGTRILTADRALADKVATADWDLLAPAFRDAVEAAERAAKIAAEAKLAAAKPAEPMMSAKDADSDSGRGCG